MVYLNYIRLSAHALNLKNTNPELNKELMLKTMIRIWDNNALTLLFAASEQWCQGELVL